MDLSKQELQGIGNLAEQGLVVKRASCPSSRQTADLEGKVLDMETASLRAKQDISKAEQDATTLQSDRDTEIAQDRQQAEADIQQLDLKMRMYTRPDERSDGEGSAGGTILVGVRQRAPTVGYAIVRETDGKATEMAADESTEVLPGDVIKVGHRRRAGGLSRRLARCTPIAAKAKEDEDRQGPLRRPRAEFRVRLRRGRACRSSCSPTRRASAKSRSSPTTRCGCRWS